MFEILSDIPNDAKVFLTETEFLIGWDEEMGK
jgi:hypothetical protein